MVYNNIYGRELPSTENFVMSCGLFFLHFVWGIISMSNLVDFVPKQVLMEEL